MTEHSAASTVPAFVHLTGRRRGTTVRPDGDPLRIGTFPGAEIQLAATGEVPPEEYAVLRRQGQHYELEVSKGKEVFVNGLAVERRILVSDDVLEIGRGGPVLRFRLYPAGSGAWKTIPQALADVTDEARRGSSSRLVRVSQIMRAVPREVATQTSWPVRAVVISLAAFLVIAVGYFAWRNVILSRSLAEERGRVAGLAELIQQQVENPRSNTELVRMLEELQTNITQTARRLQVLEGQSAASRLVIAAATRSTAFVQGAWGFVDPQTGRPLRVYIGPGGEPLMGPDGGPVVTTDERAPVLEAFFTGTAFAVGDEGHLITNRHIAEPWRFDEAAQQVMMQGWVPVMRRLRAYIPGVLEPFGVQLIATSDSADLAILRLLGPRRALPSLPLAGEPPQAGEEVIVLGYPLGMRALLARADQRFMTELRADSTADFWGVAERLARGGQIAPLASRGIVSQVSTEAVVYDAETTVGGSGGPVLSLKGEVVAVNAAILPEFGGSNLGVPARRAATLLRRTRRPAGN